MADNSNREYGIERYKKRKSKYRFKLGTEAFIQYPVLNLLWISLIAISVFIIRYLRERIEKMDLPHILEPVYRYGIVIVVIVILAGLLLALIYEIAYFIAKDDEDDVKDAFVGIEMNNKPPILKSKKKIKKHTYQRVFDTSIPADIWNEKRAILQKCMEEKIIGEIKGKENRREVTIVSIEGRNLDGRKELFDEEF